MTFEITDPEQDSRVVPEGRGSTLTAVDDIRLEEKDGGTLVDYTAILGSPLDEVHHPALCFRVEPGR